MKVLHVINSMTIGGAEMLLANTFSPGGLQEYADNILVYFNGSSPLLSKIDPAVKVICLDYSDIRRLPSVLRKLRKIITENKIDIIHSHLTPADIYVNLARPKHIPLVHTLHIAYTTDFETRPVLKLLERKLFFDKKYCNLIFLSDFAKKDFLDNIPYKGSAYVLNNFIDDAFFDHPTRMQQHTKEKGLKMIAIGNFRHQKNYFYLLEIFKHLKEYNIHLDIYGGGDIEKYQAIINENSLNITLKGQVNDINAVIPGYDLFIMSSTNEGFPLSVFEAMAAGIPVMLSNIPPLKNIVKENAVYFELDNASAAASQVISMYNNSSGIFEMAEKGRTYAENTVRKKLYIKKLMGIYEDVIQKSKLN